MKKTMMGLLFASVMACNADVIKVKNDLDIDVGYQLVCCMFCSGGSEGTIKPGQVAEINYQGVCSGSDTSLDSIVFLINRPGYVPQREGLRFIEGEWHRGNLSPKQDSTGVWHISKR